MIKNLFPVLAVLLIALVFLGGCAKTRDQGQTSPPESEQKTDPRQELLWQIFQLAEQGRTINCDFPVEQTVIDTVEEKWGKPDKVDYVAAAKGSYATYSDRNVVLGFNKGSQIFDVRSYDSSLKQITMSKVQEVLGTPGNIRHLASEDMLIYSAGEKYELLFLFPKATQENPDPKLDHYNVFYPRGTVNSMAGDPGISHLQEKVPDKATNRYEVPGINDAAAFEKTLITIQSLVEKGDKQQVAQYVLYPINVYVAGQKTNINNETEFIKYYDEIFNEKVKQALITQDVTKTFVNYQGVMVGNGEIWMTATGEGSKNTTFMASTMTNGLQAAGRKKVYRDKVISEMKKVFQAVPYGIDHTLKVLKDAEEIMEGENISPDQRELIALVAILHDIGAVEAQRKHGSMAASYQEKEGPDVARQILQGVGYDPIRTERICYIIGHHHTPAKIDGIDFQIQWEADLLANLEHMEIKNDPDKLRKYIEDNFKTSIGKRIAMERFM